MSPEGLLRRLAHRSRGRAVLELDVDQACWLLASFCTLYRKSCDTEQLARECSPPVTEAELARIADRLGLRATAIKVDAKGLDPEQLPVAVELAPADAESVTNATAVGEAAAPESTADAATPASTSEAAPADAAPVEAATPETATPETATAEAVTAEEASTVGAPPVQAARPEWAILLQLDDTRALVASPGERAPRTVPRAELVARLTGSAARIEPQLEEASDPDAAAARRREFGFRWFIPELLKHKRIWRDVLIASLALQIMALAFPLFTQTIIDKVIVHHTQSTLLALAVGMGVFVMFTAALTWIRQYLVLHTGNRVDAVLGSHAFEHLFKLPPLYFQHRPTGVVAARMQGIETIREFVSSAAVMLMLDLPFLFIFVGVMFWYSVNLTLIVLAILLLIVTASLLVAPLFQHRLNEQFLRGAANQAFLTEYVAGVETVKSLQLEPQLNRRYRDLLAAYLGASFKTRQLSNTYGTFANGLEQLMTLLILAFGAYIVMTSATFTVGMLVAFQMFASRLSQPMLRLVGLWQQFQQARLAVKRLGDIMNVPGEPYRLTRTRAQTGNGAVQIEDLAFRYAENLPYLYDGFTLDVPPGRLVAVTGPSGAGKSTLAKLLQGFYQPTRGTIRIDGIDVRHLSANELRAYFGVVPQETTLFSGTILDNVRLANPFAPFEQVVAACKMAEIHSVIESLPNGYETEIGERGAGLSGGQRQRLAIARALLKGPKILICDEATSGLDAATAEQLGRTINGLKGKVTILFIAHQMPRTLRVDETVRIGEKLSVVPGDGPLAAGAAATAAAAGSRAPASGAGEAHAGPGEAHDGTGEGER